MTGLAPVSEEHRKTVWVGTVAPWQGACLPWPGLGFSPWRKKMKERRKERGRTGREGAASEASVLSTYLLFGVSCSAEVSSARQQECVRGEVK